MQLREIMTREVQDVRPGATLKEAAEKMKTLDVGVLPVCDGEKLVGMITDRDITVRAVAEGQDPETMVVGDAMTAELVFCYEDDAVEAAVKIMEEKQIRRLPVMDRNRKLTGIVSLGDLATRQGDEHLSAEALEEVSRPNRPHA